MRLILTKKSIISVRHDSRDKKPLTFYSFTVFRLWAGGPLQDFIARYRDFKLSFIRQVFSLGQQNSVLRGCHQDSSQCHDRKPLRILHFAGLEKVCSFKSDWLNLALFDPWAQYRGCLTSLEIFHAPVCYWKKRDYTSWFSTIPF